MDPGGAGGRSSALDPGALVLNPRARVARPLGSAERASSQWRAGGARVPSQGRRQLAGMAPAAASGGSSLPSGFSVFVTFPDLLFIFEFVSGSALLWERDGVGYAARSLEGSALLSLATLAAPRGPNPETLPISRGFVPFSSSGSICRQVQRNFFPELWSYPSAASLQGAQLFPPRVSLSKQR